MAKLGKIIQTTNNPAHQQSTPSSLFAPFFFLSIPPVREFLCKFASEMPVSAAGHHILVSAHRLGWAHRSPLIHIKPKNNE
jgi:hypothetical protein